MAHPGSPTCILSETCRSMFLEIPASIGFAGSASVYEGFYIPYNIYCLSESVLHLPSLEV